MHFTPSPQALLTQNMSPLMGAMGGHISGGQS